MILHIALAMAADVGIYANNVYGPSNCIPFGMPYTSSTDHMGFIYANLPAFDLYAGDTLAFDLGAQNDVDITMDIAVAATSSNGGIEPDANGFTTIATGVTASTPRGNTVQGDYELGFLLDADFSFAGGGLIIRFQASANSAFANDNSCTQVLMYANSSDSSGYFVRRFYLDPDGLYPWSGSDTSVIGGFEITYGFWYADTDGDGYGDDSTGVQGEAPSGYVRTGGDCDDDDEFTFPGAAELESADECMTDADEDGYGAIAVGSTDITIGSDCDDGEATIYPGAEEVAYDAIDQDCDGADLCDVDADGFDYDGAECFGDDCNDDDPDINASSTEIWYDGVDQDCDGGSDFDADADGHDKGTSGGDDCDDADADTYPGAPDDIYDGVINDCDEADEYDADGDGYKSADHGGDDCDDNDGGINPAADESWYDGVDQNCDGRDDDQDGDGSLQADDCDDLDAQVGPCNTDSGSVTGTYLGGGCGGGASTTSRTSLSLVGVLIALFGLIGLRRSL